MESQSKGRIEIPSDIRPAWERSFSFLSTFLMAHQHTRILKEILGMGYSMCAFFHEKSYVVFYRSERDEEKFNNFMANRCLTEDSFLAHITSSLHKYTDEINEFLLREKALTRNNVHEFFSLLNNHFPFHLAVFWAAEPLERDNKGINNVMLSQLYEARKFNEMVLPKIEKWLVENNPECILLTPKECIDYIVNGRKIPAEELKRRKEGSFVYFNEGNDYLFEGMRAREWRERFNEVFWKRVGSDKKELRGESAFSGIYHGRVRLIERPGDFKFLKKGEVIVASVTAPSYNAYIKKAGAIVTNEGAILCHAAIVAREFKIPTIIGTKIATRIFKDGDLVEVDANEGVVRIIKK